MGSTTARLLFGLISCCFLRPNGFVCELTIPLLLPIRVSVIEELTISLPLPRPSNSRELCHSMRKPKNPMNSSLLLPLFVLSSASIYIFDVASPFPIVSAYYFWTETLKQDLQKWQLPATLFRVEDRPVK
ncbi:LOW QUALITY PROTEIN: hypothetical protein YC2023_094671 [Brassica napus]